MTLVPMGLGEAPCVPPLPPSNAKFIRLRRSCLSHGEAKGDSVMAIRLIQFESLKALTQQSVKDAHVNSLQ